MKELLDFSLTRLEKTDVRSKGDTSAFCDDCGRIICQCGQVLEMGEDGEEAWVRVTMMGGKGTRRSSCFQKLIQFIPAKYSYGSLGGCTTSQV